MTDQSAMPAYPCVLEKWETVPGYDGGMTQNYKSEYSGLTKREVFAMAAMQGNLARRGPFDHSHDAFDSMAYESVRAADALLAALEEPKP